MLINAEKPRPRVELINSPSIFPNDGSIVQMMFVLLMICYEVEEVPQTTAGPVGY
jgi:hypothetical protein